MIYDGDVIRESMFLFAQYQDSPFVVLFIH